MEYIHNLECDWCEGKVKKGKRVYRIEFTDDYGKISIGSYHESCALTNNIGRRGYFERILHKETNG